MSSTTVTVTSTSTTLTTTSSLPIPISAIVLIILGGYLIIALAAYLIQAFLRKRGICANCCACCADCTCCQACGERLDCCEKRSCNACCNACCPECRQYSILDLLCCGCCTKGETSVPLHVGVSRECGGCSAGCLDCQFKDV